MQGGTRVRGVSGWVGACARVAGSTAGGSKQHRVRCLAIACPAGACARRRGTQAWQSHAARLPAPHPSPQPSPAVGAGEAHQVRHSAVALRELALAKGAGAKDGAHGGVCLVLLGKHDARQLRGGQHGLRAAGAEGAGLAGGVHHCCDCSSMRGQAGGRHQEGKLLLKNKRHPIA